MDAMQKQAVGSAKNAVKDAVKETEQKSIEEVKKVFVWYYDMSFIKSVGIH